VGDQYVSQREFDRYREAVDRELARLERAREQHEQDHEDAEDDRANRKDRSWTRIIGLLTAVAGVVVAWVGLLSLHH